MRLWHLLIGICFAAPLGSALVPPRVANSSVAGYLLASAAGLAVAVSCSWLMWWMHKSLAPKLLRRAEQQDALSAWYGGAFYVSKALWVIFAGILGFWLSSTLLRVVL